MEYSTELEDPTSTEIEENNSKTIEELTEETDGKINVGFLNHTEHHNLFTGHPFLMIVFVACFILIFVLLFFIWKLRESGDRTFSHSLSERTRLHLLRQKLEEQRRDLDESYNEINSEIPHVFDQTKSRKKSL